MAGYKFRKAKYDTSVIGDRVKASVNKHPFMLFGLPFIAMVVVGSFMLTPATAIRYEHYDKKSQRSDKKEAIEGTGVKRRYFDPREEYYRLAARDLDNWEQRRVPRPPGDSDGIL